MCFGNNVDTVNVRNKNETASGRKVIILELLFLYEPQYVNDLLNRFTDKNKSCL